MLYYRTNMSNGKEADFTEKLRPSPYFSINETDRIVYIDPSYKQKKGEIPGVEVIFDTDEESLPWAIFKKLTEAPKKTVDNTILWSALIDARTTAQQNKNSELLDQTVEVLKNILGSYGSAIEDIFLHEDSDIRIGYKLNADVVVVKRQ